MVLDEAEQLLRKHETEWVRSLAKHTTNWTFDRGFVMGISIDPRLFLEYGEWLFINAPIRVVGFFVDDDPIPMAELETRRYSNGWTRSHFRVTTLAATMLRLWLRART